MQMSIFRQIMNDAKTKSCQSSIYITPAVIISWNTSRYAISHFDPTATNDLDVCSEGDIALSETSDRGSWVLVVAWMGEQSVFLVFDTGSSAG